MKLEDIERLSGMILTFGLVFLAVLLGDTEASWWMEFPILIILAGSCLMWRVKVAQHAIARLNEKCDGRCKTS